MQSHVFIQQKLYNSSMFDDLKNNIDFFIREKTRFSRKNFIEKNKKLLERNIKENLYTQDVLSQIFENTDKPTLKILDIGSKNWFYAKGEYDFFQSFCNDFLLEGVELDTFRLYSNFYSRYETAKFHTIELKNTNYIAGNLLDLQGKYDYIIWFLPFVTKEPLMYWGLPQKYFCPEKLLSHAYNILENDGQMLIINQGETEAQIQKELLQNLNIPYIDKGVIQSTHFQYKNRRFAYLIKKSV